jgi:uncharacterized protein YPO0396
VTTARTKAAREESQERRQIVIRSVGNNIENLAAAYLQVEDRFQACVDARRDLDHLIAAQNETIRLLTEQLAKANAAANESGGAA